MLLLVLLLLFVVRFDADVVVSPDALIVLCDDVDLIFASPADVEAPELDSLLDAIEIGLGLRDDVTELQLASDAVN